MPKGKRSAIDLPEKLKFEIIDGEKFLQVTKAAKLAGIHPAVLEMGQQLLKKDRNQGGVFTLGTAAMQAKASDIEAMFRDGLRKVAKAFGPGGLSVKSYLDRDANRIVFWYGVGYGPKPAAGNK